MAENIKILQDNNYIEYSVNISGQTLRDFIVDVAKHEKKYEKNFVHFFKDSKLLDNNKTWYENEIRNNDIIEVKFIEKEQEVQENKGVFSNLFGNIFGQKNNQIKMKAFLPTNMSEGGYSF